MMLMEENVQLLWPLNYDHVQLCHVNDKLFLTVQIIIKYLTYTYNHIQNVVRKSDNLYLWHGRKHKRISLGKISNDV